MVSRSSIANGPGFTRVALVAVGSTLLLSACAPDQQATDNRPVVQAPQAEADDSSALMRVAAMTRQSGDIETAGALYRRAFERNPADPRPLIELARMLDAYGSHADAALAWQEAGRVAPGNADVLAGYGITLARLGQPDLAQTYLRQAADRQPTAKTWNALGVVRDQTGDAAGAQAAYRAGLALAPDDTRLANNLALSLALTGQSAESVALLERVVQRPDATTRHRQNLALAYALAGRDEDAVNMGALDADLADAQRNVMRHASIAALPDHASRVAAVSAVHSSRPVRANPAVAAAEAAALVRGRQVSETNAAAAPAVDDNDRVTPIVAVSAVGDRAPQPAVGTQVAAVVPPSPPVAAPAVATVARVEPAPAELQQSEAVTEVVAETVAVEAAPQAESDAVAPVQPVSEIASAYGSDKPIAMPEIEPQTYQPAFVADGSADEPITEFAVANVVDEMAAADEPAMATASADSDAPSVAELMMASVETGLDEPMADATVDAMPVEIEAREPAAEVVAATVETGPAADMPPSLPLALAGVSVPSVDDQLIFAASAYHAEAYELAAGTWQSLADAGEVRARFHLGALHYEGRGVEKDVARAYVLLRQAERAGFADARIILALVEAKLSDTERRAAESQVAEARP